MSDAYEQERRIFDACLELPADERSEYLRSACDGDDALEDRIRRLLDAHERHSETFGIPGDERPQDPQRIGPFRILERLGEGGMGIVYSAEQTEPVRRRVALKLIKLGMDTREVIARFESERQALALMSHPNIARMLDAGATEKGRPFFVMEYVPGVPLTEYCDIEQLDLPERLELFLQVCLAVQHAHQKGVIHRDLKPSNILVTDEDGRPVPKIIDFGVAKATNQRLTERTVYTQLGRVIGTPEYMSPEQADLTALDVDTRSDIYSLGVLLYELLTGSRPLEFAGSDKGFTEIQRMIREDLPETPSERSRRMLELVPAVALKRGTTPAALVHALRRELDWITMTALAKEPRRRYQTARELAEDIERYRDDLPVRAGPTQRLYRARKLVKRHRWAIATGALAVAAVVVAVSAVSIGFGQRLGLLGSSPPLRAMLALGPEESLWLGSTRPIAISPDQARVAYIGVVEGNTWLFVRDLDTWAPRQVRDSRGARTPFFSPDGHWVGFFAQGELRKVAVDGSTAPETIAEIGLMPRGLSWGADDRIAYSLGPRGILSVAATGGAAEVLTEPQSDNGELEHQWPHWLPGGEALLYTVTRSGSSGIFEELAVKRLGEDSSRVVLPRGAQASYVGSGHLVYANAGVLEAAPFDLGDLEVTGASVNVVEAVRAYPASYWEGATYFDVSPAGSLLYVPPAAEAPVTLDWVDRQGRVTSSGALPGVPGWPRIGPDGRQVAIHVGEAGGREVWILDLERPGSVRQLTSRGGGFPTWSPDGRQIAFTSRREGSSDIYMMPADGSDEPVRVRSGDQTQIPVSWAPRGILAYYEVAGVTQRDIHMLDVVAGTSVSFVATPANELSPVFSPDGRWVAYVSNETGQNEVYARPYPPPGPVTVVSIDGGTEPVWGRDGNVLYYRHDRTLMMVPVRAESGFEAGQPRPLFEGDLVENSGGNPTYDVSSDGTRFLMLRSPGSGAPDHLRLVVGWTQELQARASGGNR